MRTITGTVESVQVGASGDDLSKQACASLQAELDGFVGDRHRSAARQNWEGEKQSEGIIRHNERLADTAFSQAAKFSRGLVGVIEVAGVINAGDEVTVEPYKPPVWLSRPEKPG